MLTRRSMRTHLYWRSTSIVFLLALSIATFDVRAETVDAAPKLGLARPLPPRLAQLKTVSGIEALRFTPDRTTAYSHKPARFELPTTLYVAPKNPLKPVASEAPPRSAPMLGETAFARPSRDIKMSAEPTFRPLNPFQSNIESPNSWDAPTGLGPQWFDRQDKKNGYLRSQSERIYIDRLMRDQLGKRH